ncbi:hypothetical protein ACRE_030910 [Hapsidospora chrysogenum ATCC 11550]|uniref:Complex 1 LYR protein domain-containing protein n=1 Tax=Hapsidospora chrysogenum (strain ATCC 11550 / CBS 779.69 / DSM 880 / IAM 14645 / JCM 23072 / IMI 49137) TaxID=857340 RepID=A0A086T9U2_HAPC1|nr:hypothetical protein ACRE_030910 [Hapsidospora chrysogenum ATCC 11550]
MARTFFVPARNSRHRVAALALYRSLVRTARQIPLPEDARNRKPGHPVAQLVRKRFEGNKTYTSLRLVYSSMAAGYKFLTMLTKAKSPESSEHHNVVSFLRTLNRKAAKQRASTPPPPSKEPKNKEAHPPLLTKVSGPAESPKYTAEPRPSEPMNRPRRVPTVTGNSYGFPFIRYSKPHPRDMDQMVRRNRDTYEKRINSIIWVEEELAPQAALEDQWDERMYREMVRAGLAEGGRSHVPQDETFLWSAMKSKLWYEWRLENMWEHWTARGEALHQLAQEERALAAKEKGENDDLGPLADTILKSQEETGEEPRRRTKKPFGQRDQVTTPNSHPMPALDMARSVERRLEKKGVDVGLSSPDPFSSPVWAQLVEKSEQRLKFWVKRSRHGGGKGPRLDDDDPLAAALLVGRKSS